MATARQPRSTTARPLTHVDERSHLRVVRPGAGRRLALRISPRTGVVLTVLLFVALFGVAVSHALLIESQVHLDQLDEQVAAEQTRYERLRHDVSELESPDRIVGEASDRLGMVPADELVWLAPDEGTTGDGTAGDPEGDGDSPGTSWPDVKPYLGSEP
jgi:cell division protein FtsL